jgi:hypothetical protein
MPETARLLPAVLLLSIWCLRAHGQEQSRGFAVQGDLGVVKFLEYRAHGAIGGSVRLPFSKRWAFQPEFQYLWAGHGHDDFLLLPNVSFDFRRPPARVRPFVILGVGLTLVRDRSGALQWTRTWWHGNAGGGVKVFLNRRWFVAPDFRVGIEWHSRFTVGIGYEFR